MLKRYWYNKKSTFTKNVNVKYFQYTSIPINADKRIRRELFISVFFNKMFGFFYIYVFYPGLYYWIVKQLINLKINWIQKQITVYMYTLN